MPDLSWLDVLARIGVAAALGGAIGLERELRDHEAGFRTHLLVAVGAALFTLAGAYGFREFQYGRATGITLDPSRIAAQVVTGIGFLGAGAIIRQGLSIRGLTTAATLWIAAALGLAAGAGFYSGAVIATAVVLFALYPLRLFSRRFVDEVRTDQGRLSIELGAGGSAAPVFTVLEGHRVAIRSLEIEDESDTSRLLVIEARLPSAGEAAVVLDDVKALEDVRRVEWKP